MGVRWGIGGLVAALLVALAPAGAAPAAATAPACTPGGPAVVMAGSVQSSDAKTYRVLPFDVAPGTTRVEVGYRWDDVVPLPATPLSGLVQTVLDLGLWDADGVGTPDGFRGWSGSRQGRTAQGQAPVWVQADTAERGYVPDPVEPGTWHVDLGIAAVAPLGATYEVTVRCLAPVVGAPFVDQPVDATHVADPDAGWYHGDFHMHGRHSHPSAPGWDGFVRHARDAGLDFLPVTDYVTTQHHQELGPVQEANPDLVIWPGREIITYFGHATVIGETPNEVDWRHGAPVTPRTGGGCPPHGRSATASSCSVSLADIQADSVADGALFGVAHPTIFPTPIFASFCRGCEFTLGSVIDWAAVDTIEVLTGPVLADDTQLGGPGLGIRVQNPFVLTAIDLWQRQLLAGHKITAVSGSDDKLGPDLGSSVTAVYADELSRPALRDAIRAGHAYIRTEGVDASPTLEMRATTSDGQDGIFGDVLHADAATVTVDVRGAAGQLLLVTRDALPVGVVPITSDDFSHTFDATRSSSSGPLGTFYRVDTLALTDGSSSPYLTTIGNPIFLAPGAPGAPNGAGGARSGPGADAALAGAGAPPGDVGGAVMGAREQSDLNRLPATGSDAAPMLAAALLGAAAAAGRLVVHRTR